MIRKTILITGASSGLGEGMARRWAAMGRNLALCARRSERLEALRAELMDRHPGIRISIKALDVNDHAQVFAVFHAFADEFAAYGGIDRIVVNAGSGKGQPLGTGYFKANLLTAETNFVAALAQFEAACEIFRKQNRGHLVAISSMSAMRGLPRNMTTYAASKAGLKALAEGLRIDLRHTPIKVSTIYPGYIRSEINVKVRKVPFIVDTETGCRALVRAIERESDEACVPAWPWSLIGFVMRHAPLAVIDRMS